MNVITSFRAPSWIRGWYAGLGIVLFFAGRVSVDLVDDPELKFPVALGWAAAGIALLALVRWLFRRGQHREQAIRDERARATAARVMDDSANAPSYSLYIHGAAMVDQLPQFDPETWRSSGGIQESMDLEALLAEAVEDSVPMIAVGNPSKGWGAGRIRDRCDNWKDVVEHLARHATLIQVVPSHTPGAVAELVWLTRNNLLWRCIFVMPPEHRNAYRRDHWERAVGTLQRSGILLPRYSADGLMFCVNSSWMVVDKEPLRRPVRRAVAAGTKRMTARIFSEALRRGQYR